MRRLNKEISMNTASVSRAEAPVAQAAQAKVLVWDLPVRVFHWLMVLSFSGAWLTAESERWRQVHITLGYTMAGLVAFRVLWGFVGPKPARFSSFVRGPARAARYVASILRGDAEHHAGHNPAGALAILALLLLAAGVTASGWANFNGVGGHAMEEVHEAAANVMLALVAIHLLGVVVGSWAHRENLVRAMVTGRKRGDPREGARRAWHAVGIALLAAVLGFWALQWQAAPLPVQGGGSAAHRPHDDGDGGDAD
jgi:cytochrome b